MCAVTLQAAVGAAGLLTPWPTAHPCTQRTPALSQIRVLLSQPQPQPPRLCICIRESSNVPTWAGVQCSRLSLSLKTSRKSLVHRKRKRGWVPALLLPPFRTSVRLFRESQGGTRPGSRATNLSRIAALVRSKASYTGACLASCLSEAKCRCAFELLFFFFLL